MATLQDITNSLQIISSSLGSLSPEDKAKFEAGTSDDILKKGLGEFGGALSSDRAYDALKKANNNLSATQYSSIVAPTEQQGQSEASKWMKQIMDSNAKTVEAEQKAKKAEDAQKNAESNLSISEQRVKDGATKGVSDGGKDTTPTTPTTLTVQDITDYGLDETSLKDPFVVAQVEASKNKQATIKSTVEAINTFNTNQDEIMKSLISNIQQQTESARVASNAEYAKRASAVQYAGITSRASMYSPEEHEGLIAEVVMNGKAKLAEINLKANEVMLNMRKDYAQDNFERYMKGVDALGKLDNLKVETVSAINSHLQNIEKQEREKLTFDQQQSDRLALQLGEELIGKDNATIMEVAKKNGIEYGALLKSVRDATYLKQKRALDLAPKPVKAEIDENEKMSKDMADTLRLAGLSKEESDNFWQDYRALGIDGAIKFSMEDGEMSKGKATTLVESLYSDLRSKDGEMSSEEKRLKDFIDSIDKGISEKNQKKEVKVEKKAEKEKESISKRLYPDVNDMFNKVINKKKQ